MPETHTEDRAALMDAFRQYMTAKNFIMMRLGLPNDEAVNFVAHTFIDVTSYAIRTEGKQPERTPVTTRTNTKRKGASSAGVIRERVQTILSESPGRRMRISEIAEVFRARKWPVGKPGTDVNMRLSDILGKAPKGIFLRHGKRPLHYSLASQVESVQPATTPALIERPGSLHECIHAILMAHKGEMNTDEILAGFNSNRWGVAVKGTSKDERHLIQNAMSAHPELFRKTRIGYREAIPQ